MEEGKSKVIIPLERIERAIFVIRGFKVMMDRDLALLYGVETRVLVQAVKRNIERFPEDFMFRLNKKELENWVSQFVISNPNLISNFPENLEKFLNRFFLPGIGYSYILR